MDQKLALKEEDVFLVRTKAFENDKNLLEDSSDYSSIYSNEPELAVDDRQEEGNVSQTRDQIGQRLLKFGLDKDGLPLQYDLFFSTREAAADFVDYSASPMTCVVLWDYYNAGLSCLDINCAANDQVLLMAEEYQVRELEDAKTPHGRYLRLPTRWSLVRWVSNKTFQPIVGLIPSCWIVSKKFFEENYRLFCRSTWYIGLAEVATAYELILEDRNSHRAGRFVVFSPCWLNVNPRDARPYILLLMCQKSESVVNKIIELANLKKKRIKPKSSVHISPILSDIPVPALVPLPAVTAPIPSEIPLPALVPLPTAAAPSVPEPEPLPRHAAGTDSRISSTYSFVDLKRRGNARISTQSSVDAEFSSEHVSTPYYLKSYTIRRSSLGRFLLFDKQYETLFDLVHHLSTSASPLPHRLHRGPSQFSELFFDAVPQPFPNAKRDIYAVPMKCERLAAENYSRALDPSLLSQAFGFLNYRVLCQKSKIMSSGLLQPPVHLNSVSYDEKGFLGRGEFGAVYRGKLNVQKDVAVDIAVKVLKRPDRNSTMYETWVAEMEVLQVVSHPNLISFYGFCYDEKAENVLLAFELMKVGSLLSYLKSKQFEVSTNEYIDFLLQIACGMGYLHSLEPPIVHGDLAARNVLMTYSPTDQTRFVLKISDFGLSRIMPPADSLTNPWCDHITLSNEKLPFKWLPPEVLHRRELSPKADVWSFGITACEIYGVVDPYGVMASEKVLPYCNDGYRMEKPDLMPSYVFDVILKCWRFQPVDRPSFAEVHQLLSAYYIEMEEVHLAIVTRRLEEYEKTKPRM